MDSVGWVTTWLHRHSYLGCLQQMFKDKEINIVFQELGAPHDVPVLEMGF